MKLSVDTLFFHKRYGDEKMIQMLADAGFDGVDYSYCGLNEDDEVLGEHYREAAYKVRWLLDDSGLVCCQAHAPLSMQYGHAFDVSVDGYRKIVRAMEAASILGADCIVVHALKVPEDIDDFIYNLGYYKSFEPYCEKFGIRIAIENIHKYHEKRKSAIGRFNTPEVLYQLLDALDSKWYAVCVDVGHAAISGPEPEELIRGLDNRVLRCLHIHDNDYQSDQHTLPYIGDLNWENITSALKEIGYRGAFSFECINYFKRFDDVMMPDALAFAVKTGRHLIDQIENN